MKSRLNHRNARILLSPSHLNTGAVIGTAGSEVNATLIGSNNISLKKKLNSKRVTQSQLFYGHGSTITSPATLVASNMVVGSKGCSKKERVPTALPVASTSFRNPSSVTCIRPITTKQVVQEIPVADSKNQILQPPILTPKLYTSASSTNFQRAQVFTSVSGTVSNCNQTSVMPGLKTVKPPQQILPKPQQSINDTNNTNTIINQTRTVTLQNSELMSSFPIISNKTVATTVKPNQTGQIILQTNNFNVPPLLINPMPVIVGQGATQGLQFILKHSPPQLATPLVIQNAKPQLSHSQPQQLVRILNTNASMQMATTPTFIVSSHSNLLHQTLPVKENLQANSLAQMFVGANLPKQHQLSASLTNHIVGQNIGQIQNFQMSNGLGGPVISSLPTQFHQSSTDFNHFSTSLSLNHLNQTRETFQSSASPQITEVQLQSIEMPPNISFSVDSNCVVEPKKSVFDSTSSEVQTNSVKPVKIQPNEMKQVKKCEKRKKVKRKSLQPSKPSNQQLCPTPTAAPSSSTIVFRTTETACKSSMGKQDIVYKGKLDLANVMKLCGIMEDDYKTDCELDAQKHLPQGAIQMQETEDNLKTNGDTNSTGYDPQASLAASSKKACLFNLQNSSNLLKMEMPDTLYKKPQDGVISNVNENDHAQPFIITVPNSHSGQFANTPSSSYGSGVQDQVIPQTLPGSVVPHSVSTSCTTTILNSANNNPIISQIQCQTSAIQNHLINMPPLHDGDANKLVDDGVKNLKRNVNRRKNTQNDMYKKPSTQNSSLITPTQVSSTKSLYPQNNVKIEAKENLNEPANDINAYQPQSSSSFLAPSDNKLTSPMIQSLPTSQNSILQRLTGSLTLSIAEDGTRFILRHDPNSPQDQHSQIILQAFLSGALCNVTLIDKANNDSELLKTTSATSSYAGNENLKLFDNKMELMNSYETVSPVCSTSMFQDTGLKGAQAHSLPSSDTTSTERKRDMTLQKLRENTHFVTLPKIKSGSQLFCLNTSTNHITQVNSSQTIAALNPAERLLIVPADINAQQLAQCWSQGQIHIENVTQVPGFSPAPVIPESQVQPYNVVQPPLKHCTQQYQQQQPMKQIANVAPMIDIKKAQIETKSKMGKLKKSKALNENVKSSKSLEPTAVGDNNKNVLKSPVTLSIPIMGSNTSSAATNISKFNTHSRGKLVGVTVPIQQTSQKPSDSKNNNNRLKNKPKDSSIHEAAANLHLPLDSKLTPIASQKQTSYLNCTSEHAAKRPKMKDTFQSQPNVPPLVNMHTNVPTSSLQTIQLTPQQQHLLKSVQFQIQRIASQIKNKSLLSLVEVPTDIDLRNPLYDKPIPNVTNVESMTDNEIHAVLQRLIVEQQKILASGKLISTVTSSTSSDLGNTSQIVAANSQSSVKKNETVQQTSNIIEQQAPVFMRRDNDVLQPTSTNVHPLQTGSLMIPNVKDNPQLHQDQQKQYIHTGSINHKSKCIKPGHEIVGCEDDSQLPDKQMRCHTQLSKLVVHQMNQIVSANQLVRSATQLAAPLNGIQTDPNLIFPTRYQPPKDTLETNVLQQNPPLSQLSMTQGEKLIQCNMDVRQKPTLYLQPVKQTEKYLNCLKKLETTLPPFDVIKKMPKEMSKIKCFTSLEKHKPVTSLSMARPKYPRHLVFQSQTKVDEDRSHKPDYVTPFYNKEEAVKQLIRYHCMNRKDDEILPIGNDAFKNDSLRLRNKFQELSTKFQHLLVQESRRVCHTSEICLINRLFLSDLQSEVFELSPAEEKVDVPAESEFTRFRNCNMELRFDANQENLLDGEIKTLRNTDNELQFSTNKLVEDKMKKEQMEVTFGNMTKTRELEIMPEYKIDNFWIENQPGESFAVNGNCNKTQTFVDSVKPNHIREIMQCANDMETENLKRLNDLEDCTAAKANANANKSMLVKPSRQYTSSQPLTKPKMLAQNFQHHAIVENITRNPVVSFIRSPATAPSKYNNVSTIKSTESININLSRYKNQTYDNWICSQLEPNSIHTGTNQNPVELPDFSYRNVKCKLVENQTSSQADKCAANDNDIDIPKIQLQSVNNVDEKKYQESSELLFVSSVLSKSVESKFKSLFGESQISKTEEDVKSKIQDVSFESLSKPSSSVHLNSIENREEPPSACCSETSDIVPHYSQLNENLKLHWKTGKEWDSETTVVASYGRRACLCGAYLDSTSVSSHHSRWSSGAQNNIKNSSSMLSNKHFCNAMAYATNNTNERRKRSLNSERSPSGVENVTNKKLCLKGRHGSHLDVMGMDLKLNESTDSNDIPLQFTQSEKSIFHEFYGLGECPTKMSQITENKQVKNFSHRHHQRCSTSTLDSHEARLYQEPHFQHNAEIQVESQNSVTGINSSSSFYETKLSVPESNCKLNVGTGSGLPGVSLNSNFDEDINRHVQNAIESILNLQNTENDSFNFSLEQSLGPILNHSTHEQPHIYN